MTVDKESILDQAKIFTGSEEKLTKYQKRMNQSSIDLYTQNPNLLMGKKGDLMKMAQEKVHADGYIYK